MYCNRCGKPIQPHHTGRCNRCLYEEATSKMSISEFSAMLSKANREVKKQNRKKEIGILLAVIVVGFILPIVWIGYAIYKAWPLIKKYTLSSSSSRSTRFYSNGNSSCSFTSVEDESSEKKFVFTGGDGNVYESGGLFCDWAGNHLEWGSSFRDSRGNMVAWGQPFYDNRDNYTAWGSPFYDAGDNYICPRS